jgi:hypothetical protein
MSTDHAGSPTSRGQAGPFQSSARSLASALKILINRAIRGSRPGAERTVSAISPFLAMLMWQGQLARRPVLPPSEHYRVLSEGLEGLAAGNRANTGKDTHASL